MTLDPASIGTFVGLALIAFLQTWNARRTKRVEQKVAITAETVEKVHLLTNSAMGLQKKALAQVSAAKAAITHDPEDQKIADSALSDYLEHIGKQSKVDKP